MALHEQCLGATDEWYPGRHVTPWIPAVEFITRDSLSQVWPGFLWMNPPFGGRNGIRPWLERFFIQGHGIALTPDRTSAPWWQEFAPKAAAILFVARKLKFIGANGQPGKSPAQGTCLMAAGERAVAALERAQGHGLGFVMTSAQMAKHGESE